MNLSDMRPKVYSETLLEEKLQPFQTLMREILQEYQPSEFLQLILISQELSELYELLPYVNESNFYQILMILMLYYIYYISLVHRRCRLRFESGAKMGSMCMLYSS